MITFTKEQLIASAHARIEFAEMMLAVSIEPLKEHTWLIELELARIALASLEADPVAWLRESALKDTHTGAWTPIIHMESERMGVDLTESWGVSYIPLYIAPPAPVSVPEEVSWEDVPEEITEYDMALASAWAHGFNQCRAAMLQGADGNSPVIPDGGEHGFCQRHQDTRRLTHPYKQLSTYPPRPSTYCPKCDPEVAEWVELDKQLRKDN